MTVTDAIEPQIIGRGLVRRPIAQESRASALSMTRQMVGRRARSVGRGSILVFSIADGPPEENGFHKPVDGITRPRVSIAEATKRPLEIVKRRGYGSSVPRRWTKAKGNPQHRYLDGTKRRDGPTLVGAFIPVIGKEAARLFMTEAIKEGAATRLRRGLFEGR